MRNILLCIILLITGCNLLAQIPSLPNENIWVTDNTVKTITVDGGYTYIGGTFSYVGPNTGNTAMVTTASPVPGSYPKVNGTVSCIIPDGSGGWFLGGEFTKVGTFSRNSLAHITSAGAVDNTWENNVNGQVYSMVIYDGYLYVAGGFMEVKGISGFAHLARINIGTGTVDAGWTPQADGPVISMGVNSTGQLYITGMNFTVGGFFLKKLDCAAGVFDAVWLPGAPGGIVMSIAVNSSDEVFVGGSFGNIGIVPIVNLAKLDPVNGLVIPGGVPSPDDMVEVIVPKGNDIYIGGQFSHVNGILMTCLARFNRVTGLPDGGWIPSPVGLGSASVKAIAFDGDGNVYAGGTFTTVGGETRNDIAKVSGTDGTVDGSWVSNASNVVNTIAVNGSNVFIGGNFSSLGGQPRKSIAKLDNSTGALVTGWKADLSDGASVYSIAVNGDYVYVGGDYSTIDGSAKPYLSRVNINTGNVDASWTPGADQLVSAIVKDGTDIYVGGNFTNIFSSSAKKYLVKLDADGNLAADWSPAPDGVISALAIDGGNLYAAGSFNNIDGQPRKYLAKLDKLTGHLVPAWVPTNDAAISSLVVDGSYVYIAGGFSKINENLSFSRLGRVNKTDGTLDEIWHPAPDAYVNTVATDGSNVYVGGEFTSIGGQSIGFFAKVNNTDGSADPSWNFSLDTRVHSLVVAGDALLVGGAFQVFNNEAITSFAAFTGSGSLPVELTSFTAAKIDKGVELKWATATEQNNYGFEIQRIPLCPPLLKGEAASAEGDLGCSTWQKIGFVEGAGNSNSPKEYSFIDTNPLQGNAQYRLKQIDLDGNYKYYSQLAEVSFTPTDVKEKLLPKEFGLSQNYPNPFNPTTTISYSIPENPLSRGVRGVSVTLKVYDMLGNEVSTLVNETKAPGYYSVTFSAANLSTGVYIYRITAGSFTAAKKLMLMK